MTTNDALTDRDRAILEFEAEVPRGAGAKEEAIRQQLQLSPVRYYRRLNALLDLPAAMQEYPLMVKRLRRLRNRRAVTRSHTSAD